MLPQRINGAEAWHLAYRLTQMNREDLLEILRAVNADWEQYAGEHLDYDEDAAWDELLEKIFSLSLSTIKEIVEIRDNAMRKQLIFGKYIKLKSGETAIVLAECLLGSSQSKIFILVTDGEGVPQRREVDLIEIAEVLGDASIKLELIPQEGESDDTI